MTIKCDFSSFWNLKFYGILHRQRNYTVSDLICEFLNKNENRIISKNPSIQNYEHRYKIIL